MTNKETMTNERAKDVLQEQIDRYGREYDAEGIEALKMAIKALEQQPCEYKPFTIDELENEDMQKLLREFQNQKTLAAEHDCLPSVTIIEPSEDCISRQATIDAIYKKYVGGKDAIDNAPINDLYACGLEEAVDAVENMPSVTPQPKIGKWIDEGFYAEGRSEHAYRCSECNEYYIGYIGEFKHCPNCGSWMEGGSEE